MNPCLSAVGQAKADLSVIKMFFRVAAFSVPEIKSALIRANSRQSFFA
jgi:hypothetical protein